jgi:hypothetical protein
MRLLLILMMSLSVQVTRKWKENIFIDDGLQDVDGDEDKPPLPSISSPEHVSASTLEAETPQATTSSTAAVGASRVDGEIVSKLEASSHIQKAHPLQQIIGNLNERTTCSSRSVHLSCFSNMLFVASLSLEILDMLFLIQVESISYTRS